MCDYSLHSVRSRPAKIGDKLVTMDFFGTGTRGFASMADLGMAVCVLPGTELAFAGEIHHKEWTIRFLIRERFVFPIRTQHRTAIFRQRRGNRMTHHDALEFPDGQIVLLTRLCKGQEATILQLSAEPRTPENVKGPEREPICT